MGNWFGTYHAQAVAALYDEQVPSWLAEALAKKLARAGVLVSSAYYVPDIQELYGLMKTWSHHMNRGTKGARWVMCRETHDALGRIHGDRRVPRTPVLAFIAEGAEPPEPESPINVISMRPARLFDIEVRIDPAARSPLFEVDSEATRQRGELWPQRDEYWRPE